MESAGNLHHRRQIRLNVMYWKKAIQVFAGATAIALLYGFTIGNIKTVKARKSAKLYPKGSVCKPSFGV
jgi:hypothetical protein